MMVTPNTIVSVTEDDDGLVRIKYRKQLPKKYHSALNRMRNESVHRSKSFQEQGVQPKLRNSRFFVSRHQPSKATAPLSSDFSAVTVSQNIEITVQNEDGVVKFADDDDEDGCGNRHHHRHTLDGSSSAGESFDRFAIGSEECLKGGGAGGGGGGGHLLSRIYRRLRKLTVAAWRRQKCKSRFAKSYRDCEQADRRNSVCGCLDNNEICVCC